MATIEEAVQGGVSFALTDEQKELRALAREFAAKEIRPKAAEYDVAMQHPADVIAKAHGLGLMNLHIPVEYGGLGLGAFDGMLVSDEQKARWLPPLLEEPILCSFGLSEPEAGSDVARLKTTAERRGDEYVLNGSKTLSRTRATRIGP